jgi:hypothetical protein
MVHIKAMSKSELVESLFDEIQHLEAQRLKDRQDIRSGLKQVPKFDYNDAGFKLSQTSDMNLHQIETYAKPVIERTIAFREYQKSSYESDIKYYNLLLKHDKEYKEYIESEKVAVMDFIENIYNFHKTLSPTMQKLISININASKLEYSEEQEKAKQNNIKQIENAKIEIKNIDFILNNYKSKLSELQNLI